MVSELRGKKGRGSECEKPIKDRKQSELWGLLVTWYDYHGVQRWGPRAQQDPGPGRL